MKKIDKCDQMHIGWELDNKVWVVENSDGVKQLMTTSHGGEYVMGLKELDEKIAETEESLKGLKRIKNLII